MSTTERSLAVLAALQSRPSWSGPELAERLGVTPRTVRRDVERLRLLGYPVESDLGAHGGYRLGVGGAAVPPLMLDADEAFALAVSVRAAGTTAVAGVSEDAARALGKLEQLLPAALRAQVQVVGDSLIRVERADEQVDASVLKVVSAACRSGERVAIEYQDRAGRRSERRLEPYRVVGIGRRWYLVAFDLGAKDWRTLRVDRIASARGTGHRFQVADPPDAVDLVRRAISVAPYRWDVRVEVQAPLAEVESRVPPSVAVTEAVGERATSLTTGGDDLDLVALHLLSIDLPLRVVSPPELVARMAALADRARAVVDASGGGQRG